MTALQLPPLSLYIHIPWCIRKCPYCDFNSHELAQPLPEPAYIAQLLLDLEQQLPLVQGRKLTSIFFGGGTPSLLSGAAVAEILDGVAQRIPLGADIEITLEANPGTAEAEKFCGFAEAGVNRLSIGVQSFDSRLLQALGRVHNGEQALAAIGLARQAGFQRLNVDLMHGLPGQLQDDAEADLRIAIEQNAGHISWYQLTIEPNTAFYKRPPELPEEDTLIDIQDSGEALLLGAKYQHYEVSAWGQKDNRCRHNLNYWRFGDYLAIGAGAHGKVTDLAKGEITRYSRTRLPADYLALQDGQFDTSRRVLKPDDLVGEFMMNGLRLLEGFDLDHFSACTGLSRNALQPGLDELLEKGLLVLEGNNLRASATGMRYLDNVVAGFFS